MEMEVDVSFILDVLDLIKWIFAGLFNITLRDKDGVERTYNGERVRWVQAKYFGGRCVYTRKLLDGRWRARIQQPIRYKVGEKEYCISSMTTLKAPTEAEAVNHLISLLDGILENGYTKSYTSQYGDIILSVEIGEVIELEYL